MTLIFWIIFWWHFIAFPYFLYCDKIRIFTEILVSFVVRFLFGLELSVSEDSWRKWWWKFSLWFLRFVVSNRFLVNWCSQLSTLQLRTSIWRELIASDSHGLDRNTMMRVSSIMQLVETSQRRPKQFHALIHLLWRVS